MSSECCVPNLPARRGLHLATLALALAGCGEGSPTAPPPPPAPLTPSFRIEPPQITMVAAGEVQFRALDSAGQPVPVLWGLESPVFGTISPTGFLSTCFVGGTTHVTARAQADTAQVVKARVDLVVPAVAIVSVQAIRYAATQAPAKLDSLAGPMDVAVTVPAGLLKCLEILALRLELLAGSTVFPLGSVTFSPAPTANLIQTFRWDAAAIANGSYALRAVITLARSGDQASNSIPVQIRNP